MDDREYLKKRVALIPKAIITSHAILELRGKRKKASGLVGHHAQAFTRQMIVLSIEAGIVNEGNLILFDAHRLPSSWNPRHELVVE